MAARDPFRLVRAIAIGVSLGFAVVIAATYMRALTGGKNAPASRVLPPDGRTRPHPSKTAGDRPSDATAAGDDADAPEAEKKTPEVSGERTAVPSNPTPGSGGKPDSGKTADAEPPLVPAVDLTYPKVFSRSEMTEALRPILAFRVSDADAALIKDAVAAAGRGQADTARAAASKIGDPAGRKLVLWKIIAAAAEAPLTEVQSFAGADRLYPLPPLSPAFERALFLSGPKGPDALRYFSNRKASTGPGKAALGGALIEAGERERGLALVKLVWARYDLDADIEARFVERFGPLLAEEDNARRARWLSLRAGFISAAGTGNEVREQAAKEPAAAREAARLQTALLARNARRAAIQAQANELLRARLARYKRAAIYKRARRRHGAAAIDGGIPANDGIFRALAHRSMAQMAAYRMWQRWKPPSAGAREKPAPTVATDGKASQDAADPKKPDAKKADEKASGQKTAAKPTAQQKAAEGALKLAKEVTAPPASLLLRLKQLRRQSPPKMWSVLRSLDALRADTLAPEAWWEFRRTEVRHALNQGHPKTAYAIAKAHGTLEEETGAEAEFLAGWIALRFLKNPSGAETHFLLSKASSWTGRDKARAFYWLGRTKAELRQRPEADMAFAEAANYFTAYYGSLALQAGGGEPACVFRTPPRPSTTEIAAAGQEDIFKSLMVMKQLDLQGTMVAYVLELARQLEDEHRIALVLELAERIAPPHLAIRAAKIAVNRGFPMEAYAYPALLPKFDKAGDNLTIEPALLNALTRQESEFHSGSVSGAGARGLMQLMPGTARLVANANKLKFDLTRLVTDPAYNVTLGSGFLASLLAGYDGSYVLSLAAYNAGPGRAGQWLRAFGDPRSATVDPVDWVERIPIAETRDYVERILESLQLYRCRFERGKTTLQLVRDLNRGRAKP